MEPVSLLVVTVTALFASSVKSLVKSAFDRWRGTSPQRLEIVTASGKKITIDASQLTREKVAEITGSSATAHATF